MGFRKTALPLFVDLHTSIDVDKEKYFDLILAPSFYWIKHVSIPVKSLSEVKRFLPSLFEDTLPAGKYSYYAYQDGDAYLIFAYNDKEILDVLAEKGIDPEQINRVYFSQSEFQGISQAVAIDESFVLDIQDRVVVKIPKEFVDSAIPLDLQTHAFSDHAITLARYAHIATTKSLAKFALFMGALISIFVLDWIVTKEKIAEFDDAPLRLYAEHKLPATRVQNEVIFETFQKRYMQQISMRQNTGKILDLKLGKNEYVSFFEVQEKRLKVEIKLASEKRAFDVAKALQDKVFQKEEYKNGFLRLEMEL